VSLGAACDCSPLQARPEPRLWLGRLADADLTCLSAQERAWGADLAGAQAHRYRSSRAALRQVLSPALGLDPKRIPLHSPPGQPPRLAAGLGWISLSHSGDGVLIGYSGEPIGVDLEPSARPLDAAALMRRFYPPAEQEQLRRCPTDGLRQAVLTSWVLKEAAIKWRRRSLAIELVQWCYDHGSGRLLHLAEGLQPACSTGVRDGWRWAAVGAGCETVPLVCQP